MKQKGDIGLSLEEEEEDLSADISNTTEGNEVVNTKRKPRKTD